MTNTTSLTSLHFLVLGALAFHGPAAAMGAPGASEALLASGTAPTEQMGPPGGPRLSALVAGAMHDGASAAVLSDAAHALGTASIPAILDMLEAGQIHEAIGNGGVLVHRLQGDAREGLELALRRFQWETVRRHIAKRLEGTPSPLRRTSSLVALGVTVPSGALSELLAPLEGLDSSYRRRLRGSAQAALKCAVERDENLLPELPRYFETAPPELVAGTVEVAAGLEPTLGLRSLSQFIGSYPEADPLILVEIAQVAKTARRPVAAPVLAPIRRMLTGSNVVAQVEAIKALGRLDDVAAIPDAIRLMRSPHKGLREEARRTLERLSAERFGSEADAWQHWHEQAQSWLRHEAPALRGQLGSTDPAKVTTALLQVARYRVFRHELDGEVARAAQGTSGQAGIVACAVLGHFGTDKAVATLLRILGDNGEDELRKAALEALMRATGENHGESVEAWVAAGFTAQD